MWLWDQWSNWLPKRSVRLAWGRGQPRCSFSLLFSGPQRNNSTLHLQKPAASKSFCPLASSSYLGKDSRIQCLLARVPPLQVQTMPKTKPDFTLAFHPQLHCQFMVSSVTCYMELHSAIIICGWAYPIGVGEKISTKMISVSHTNFEVKAGLRGSKGPESPPKSS